jgi:hypothetical protein
MTDNDPISWRALVYGTAVVTADGTKIGTVAEVLGSDSEDIFHGLRVATNEDRDVSIDADDISDMTSAAVTTTLSADAVAALPDYDQSASYHAASGGSRRGDVEWRDDSKSDEEPG